MGIKISTVFGDRFLSADNFAGGKKGQVFSIVSSRVETIGGKDKVVIDLADESGEVSTWPLNRTNALNIAEIHGDETDAWRNKAICVYEDRTMFNGKSTPCLRVREPAAATAPAAAAAKK